MNEVMIQVVQGFKKADDDRDRELQLIVIIIIPSIFAAQFSCSLLYVFFFC